MNSLSLLLILPLLLSGCASFGQPFEVRPTLERITLDVRYHASLEELRRFCPPGSVGCASHAGRYNGDVVIIHTLRPESFDDATTCTAGHELWHSLGATHEMKVSR